MDNHVLGPIAKTMLRKLQIYDSLVCSNLANLAKALDSRLSTDLIKSSDLLCRYIIIADRGQSHGQ